MGRSLGKCNEAHLLPVDAVTTPLALICVLRGLSATAQGRVAPLIDSAPLPHDLPVESPAAQLVFWDLQAIASRPDSVVGWIMSTPEADAPGSPWGKIGFIGQWDDQSMPALAVYTNGSLSL